jgi:hypothetical protein
MQSSDNDAGAAPPPPIPPEVAKRIRSKAFFDFFCDYEWGIFNGVRLADDSRHDSLSHLNSPASSQSPALLSLLSVVKTPVVRKLALNFLETENTITELEVYLMALSDEEKTILKGHLQRNGQSLIDSIKLVLEYLARPDGVLAEMFQTKSRN